MFNNFLSLKRFSITLPKIVLMINFCVISSHEAITVYSCPIENFIFILSFSKQFYSLTVYYRAEFFLRLLLDNNNIRAILEIPLPTDIVVIYKEKIISLDLSNTRCLY